MLLLCFCGCTASTAPEAPGTTDPEPAETAPIPTLRLTERGELLDVRVDGTDDVGIIAFQGRKAVLESEDSEGNLNYYSCDLDTMETHFRAAEAFGIVSSGDTVLLGDGTIAASDLFEAEDGTCYRTIYGIREDRVETYSRTPLADDGFPFVYLQKLSETEFLAAEIDPGVSTLKKFDVETGSCATLLSREYVDGGDRLLSGNVIRAACVSGDSLYVLLLTLDSEECWEIERYDLAGNYLATLDTSDAKRYFPETPYRFHCVSGHFILNNINGENGVYRVDGNTLTEIVAPEESLKSYFGGYTSCFQADSRQYLFLAYPREQASDLLIALDLQTDVRETLRLKAAGPDQYLYAFRSDASGNLIVSMWTGALGTGSAEIQQYYLSAETLDEALSGAP